MKRSGFKCKTPSKPKKAKKKPLPTLPKLKKKAWNLLSLCIRQEAANADGYVHCYTCDKRMLWKQAQAGHAIPGRTGAVLLDESIIRCQCYHCNVGLGGNYTVFAVKLIEENGLEWLQNKLDQSRIIKKWNRTDLMKKIASYEARLLDL